MAMNAYLKIKDLKGTSKVVPDAIEIHSFSWGVSNASAAAQASGESRAGKPSFGDLHVSKNVDPTSPKLLENCCTNKAFEEAELGYMKQMDNQNLLYFKIILKQVYVSSLSVSGSEDNPSEQLSVAYEQIEFAYNPEKPDKKGLAGWIGAKYDIKANKKF